MNNLKTIFSIFIFLPLLFSSCSSDEEKDCIGFQKEYVISVEAPAEVKSGEPINILVAFRVYSGCGGFGKFIESGSGMTRTIEVEAKYEGCICPQNVPIIETTYTFTPETPGEYIFKFRSGPDEFITATVIVIP